MPLTYTERQATPAAQPPTTKTYAVEKVDPSSTHPHLTDETRSLGTPEEAGIAFADLSGHGQPYIAYRPRDLYSPAFQVHRPGYQTDPNAPWYNHGNKTFLLGMGRITKESKAATRVEAEAWASERYGIKGWKRDPFGSWGDAEFVDRRIKELKAQVREKREGEGN